MHKKILSLMMVLALCGTMFAGCGGNTSSSQSTNSPAGGTDSGAAGSSATTALPQEVKTLRIGIMVSANTAHAEATKEFARLVEEKSGGSLKVEVYTDGTLGNEVEMWEGIQSGSVDMMWTGDGAVSSYVPEYGFVALPFIFEDQDHRDAFISSGTVEILDKIVEEKGNVVVLGHGSGVSRNLLANKSVTSLSEAQGLKMRVQASDIVVQTWESLGLLPIVIAYAETYSSLQTGVAQACENEMSTFLTQKWYECCPYLIKSEHQTNCHPLIIGKKQFDSLTEEQQAVLKECGNLASDVFVSLERAQDAEGDAELTTNGGVTICELTDKDAWIDATEKVRTNFYEQYGLQELAEKVEALRK